MCRLLGVLASDTRDFGLCLQRAPRSLAALSTENPDGWGIAVWEPTPGWLLRKQPACAQRDVSFDELARQSRGQALVAHVRLRTVGHATLENTHPFQCGRWIFAHNGTIDEVEYLRSHVSPARRADVRGSTDSELLFALLLTRLDGAGLGEARSNEATDRVVADTVDELARRPSFGSYNFVLCDGETLYAQRRGRSLFVLERNEPGGQTTGLVASEPVTHEPWRALAEGALVHCRRAHPMRWHTLRY
ncbi:MAG TPA: class II glutamine amidotransferase [Polyangiaceae bacterium]